MPLSPKMKPLEPLVAGPTSAAAVFRASFLHKGLPFCNGCVPLLIVRSSDLGLFFKPR